MEALTQRTETDIDFHPRQIFVPNWPTNIRFAIVARMAELGHNITLTPTEKTDENGNRVIQVTFGSADASRQYHTLNSDTQAVRKLRDLEKRNPHSPYLGRWIREGLPEVPTIYPEGSTVPALKGIHDLVTPPQQLELPNRQ